MSVIRIAAAVILDERGRTLLVRKRGTQAFMQAGGKLAPRETPLDALRREVREELGCAIGSSVRPLGRASAPAANEAGHLVEAELFHVVLQGQITPGAEIEEAVWHDPDADDARMLAPLTHHHVMPLVRAIGRGL